MIFLSAFVVFHAIFYANEEKRSLRHRFVMLQKVIVVLAKMVIFSKR